MKTMLIVVLALCAMAVAEEETLQAEEQTLLSYGAYPHAFRYGYGAVPYAGYPYAARTVLPYAARSVLPYAYPSTYAVAAAAAPLQLQLLGHHQGAICLPSPFLPLRLLIPLRRSNTF